MISVSIFMALHMAQGQGEIKFLRMILAIGGRRPEERNTKGAEFRWNRWELRVMLPPDPENGRLRQYGGDP